MKHSSYVRAAKLVLLAAGVLFNILAISVPLVPEEIRDRVLLSSILSIALVTLLAFEEIRLVIQEQHEETRDRLARVDNYLLCISLYRSLRNIEDNNDNMFHRLSKGMLMQLESRLREVEHGKLALDNVANTSELALELAKDIQKSLEATAMWEDTSLRGRQERDAYLEMLAVAAKDRRRAVIKRLFLINRGSEKDREFRKRVKEDLNNHVQVRYLYLDSWANMQGVPYATDFGIWDDKRVWVYTRHPEQAPNQQRGTILNDRASIVLYKGVFAANWGRGTVLRLEDVDFVD